LTNYKNELFDKFNTFKADVNKSIRKKNKNFMIEVMTSNKINEFLELNGIIYKI
jgi:hypothetical protein